VWSWRGALYEMYANSLMLDYAPEFSKLHRWGSDFFGRPKQENVILLSSQNIHSYMMLGWETGIHNEFATLLRNGMSVKQTMELVMFSQLYAGMRGLGHVFRAVGETLPQYAAPTVPLPLPPGWAPDNQAFKCGLDFTTREMTRADLANLTAWYEKNIGYVPKSIQFGLKYHPEFVKVNRGKWEVAIRTLPKQIVPYIMLRHHAITGSEEGLREATLLALAWGITPELIARAITATAMFYTSFEGLYAPFKVVNEILEARGRAGS
jgi:alkylhydroperoxidase/carboxymuconolactone decarboxylase family protein YurZ